MQRGGAHLIAAVMARELLRVSGVILYRLLPSLFPFSRRVVCDFLLSVSLSLSHAPTDSYSVTRSLNAAEITRAAGECFSGRQDASRAKSKKTKKGRVAAIAVAAAGSTSAVALRQVRAPRDSFYAHVKCHITLNFPTPPLRPRPSFHHHNCILINRTPWCSAYPH